MPKLDSFEIQIQLTETQAALVSLWLERFHARSIHAWSIPVLKGQALIIHPADFTNLISFAKPGDCSELEFYRLRKLGASIIEATLTEQKSELSQELKDMTLNTLRGLAPQEQMHDSVEIITLNL